MPRKKAHVPLAVYLNGHRVGSLLKQSSGAIEFAYAQSWLAWEHTLPVSLSLPLREAKYIGAPVAAVFENLLPDSAPVRTRVAERVGASGIDAYSLLTQIGRDCVGALQFMPEGEDPAPSASIEGTEVNEAEIENILVNLARAPLGLDADDDFRVSVAGAQEKTALLRHEGRWLRPTGVTPTTHILKPQIGHVNTGGGIVDLSNSVENEYYCLRLMAAFGLRVNAVEMITFGETTALVIERFDRRWARDGRLIRLPQEDLCQALSVPPTAKYESDGGPGIVDIARFLQGSDDANADRATFLKAQLLFWLIGATDGHAKNFSVFLKPGGRFELTPLYDVLTVQPGVDAHQIRLNSFKLAMAVGTRRHYRMREIHGRHFVETAQAAGLSLQAAHEIIDDIHARSATAFDNVVNTLPRHFPEAIHQSVLAASQTRLRALDHLEAA